MITWLIFIANAIGMIVLFISATGRLVDENQGNYKFVTPKGYLLLGLCLMLIFLPIIQNHFSDEISKKDNEARESRLKKEYEIKTKEIIISLAEYGLKYNESQKRMEKLVRDSMRTTIIQAESPTLILSDENGKLGFRQEGKHSFIYYIYCKDASAKNINLDASFLVSNDNTKFDYNGKRILIRNRTIAKDYILSGTLDRDTSVYYKHFYMWLRGSYMNNSQTITFYFDEILRLDNDANGTSIINGDAKTEVVRMINSFEKAKPR